MQYPHLSDMVRRAMARVSWDNWSHGTVLHQTIGRFHPFPSAKAWISNEKGSIEPEVGFLPVQICAQRFSRNARDRKVRTLFLIGSSSSENQLVLLPKCRRCIQQQFKIQEVCETSFVQVDTFAKTSCRPWFVEQSGMPVSRLLGKTMLPAQMTQSVWLNKRCWKERYDHVMHILYVKTYTNFLRRIGKNDGFKKQQAIAECQHLSILRYQYGNLHISPPKLLVIDFASWSEF